MSARNRIRVDVAIVGGGIAGLWLLNLLRGRGYSAVLIERRAFGDGQTICSQGMIHGGLKYALSGALNTASEAVAAMPERWRACLSGSGEVDLRGVQTSSNTCYLWSPDESMLARLGGFLASKALRGRVRRLDAARVSVAVRRRADSMARCMNSTNWSSTCLHCSRGWRRHNAGTRFWPTSTADQFVCGSDGSIASLQLRDVEIHATRFVFAAGAGNEALADRFGESAPPMQRRPLRQVVVRHAKLPALYGHCVPQLPNSEPRMTVTTHTDARGAPLWYLGGQLASDGAATRHDEQIRHARAESAACLPWLDLSDAQLQSLYDRPRGAGTKRRTTPRSSVRCNRCERADLLADQARPCA